MKKSTFLSAMAAFALALGLVFAGCDPGNGGDETVTLTLTKLSATSFSVTVDGANWKNNDGLITGEATSLQLAAVALWVLDDSDFTVDGSNQFLEYKFNGSLSSDLKTITIVLDPLYGGLSGTLKFSDDLGSVAGQTGNHGATDGGLSPDAGGNTIYVGTPSEGISFP
jgi:hypothetical protein